MRKTMRVYKCRTGFQPVWTAWMAALLWVVLFSALTAEAANPVVSNVRASQRPGTKLVDIWFNVSDSDGDRVNISVGVRDGGSTVPASSLSGYLGNNRSCGYNKKITWNAGEDWSGNLATLTITVTADDSETGICPVPKTGQTTSYRSGDDGYYEKGVSWPNPRFTDHGDGTVTDNLTGLEWVKAPHSLSGNSGSMDWNDAVDFCRNLYYAGHSDWRLPNIKELESMVHCGKGSWGDRPYEWLNSSETPFTGIRPNWPGYWSGTSGAGNAGSAWPVNMYYGYVYRHGKTGNSHVWPVRGGGQ